MGVGHVVEMMARGRSTWIEGFRFNSSSMLKGLEGYKSGCVVEKLC